MSDNNEINSNRNHRFISSDIYDQTNQ